MTTPSRPAPARLDSGRPFAPVAVDAEGFDRLVRHLGRNDIGQLVDLALAGEVLAVPRGTRVEVIDHALTAVHVRIVDGEFAGRTGWAPLAWLHPAAAAPLDHLLGIAAAKAAQRLSRAA